MRLISRSHPSWRGHTCATRLTRPGLALGWSGSLWLRQVATHTQAITVPVASTSPEPTATVTLRPYQQECIDVCLARLREGIRRQAVSLPVGSGKTVIFSHLIARIPPPHPKATQVLVLAHREELLHQACRQIARHAPHLTVDLEQGSNYAATNADVIVASVASLGRQNSSRLQRLDPTRFKAIIIDEAHHAVADTYLRVLDHFDATHAQTSVFVWGCSATLKRHDHLALNRAFDYISFHLDFTRMIEAKWLCRLKAVSVHTSSDISNVRKVAGDFAVKQLSHQVNTPERNDLVVRMWKKLNDQRQSTLVFAVDVAHIHSLAAAFQAHNIDARVLSGQTRREDRVDLLAQFARQEFPVLINCAILTEGTDIPTIDCIIMARPTRSAVLYQQMVGRGLRLAPGKTDCLIIDLVDVLRSRANVITTPSLTGVDPQVILPSDPKDPQRPLASTGADGDLVLSHQMAQDAKQARVNASPTKVKLRYYEDPFQVQGDCSGDPQLLQLSRYAWVKVSDTLYAVVIQQLYSIAVERTDSHQWRGYYRMRRLSRFPTAPTVIIDNQPTWVDALQGCDTWITKSFRSTSFDQRTAPWRQKPASEAQRQELERRKVDLSIVTKGKPETLTKGMACNLILRLSLGAGKAWKKKKPKPTKPSLKIMTPALPEVQVGFIAQSAVV